MEKNMTETILDSLVVKIRADSAALRGQLNDIEQDFGGLEYTAEKVASGLSRVFDNFKGETAIPGTDSLYNYPGLK